MKKAKPPAPVNLVVSDQRTRDYYTIRAFTVAMDKDGQPHTVGGWKYEPLRAWSSFSINAQGDTEAPRRGALNGLYGAEALYRSPFEVDEELAHCMYRMLKLVREGMEEFYRAFGNPRTFGQYVSRVGTIMGIERVLLPPSYWHVDQPWQDWRTPSLWAQYEFKALTLGEGADAIDDRIARWQENEEGVVSG